MSVVRITGPRSSGCLWTSPTRIGTGAVPIVHRSRSGTIPSSASVGSHPAAMFRRSARRVSWRAISRLMSPRMPRRFTSKAMSVCPARTRHARGHPVRNGRKQVGGCRGAMSPRCLRLPGQAYRRRAGVVTRVRANFFRAMTLEHVRHVERIENGSAIVNSRMSTMAGWPWHKDGLDGLRIFLPDVRRR